MKATFEEGTEIVLDSETVALTTGYVDVATAIERKGDLVTLALHFTATARAAWKEKEKYALGAIVTEGGKTYVLTALEPEAEKSKPTTDAGAHWTEIAAPLVLCTLPTEYAPAVEVNGQSNHTTVKVGADGTVKLGAAESNDALVIYRAAGVSP